MFWQQRLRIHTVLPAAVGVIRWVARKVRPPRPPEPLPDPFAGLAAASGIEATLRSAWRSAAEAAGLTEIVESDRGEISDPTAGPFLEGRAGRLTVRLDRPNASVPGCTRICILGLGHGYHGFTVLPGWSPSSMAESLASGGLRLGVPGFDGAFRITGDVKLAIALLDPATRRLMMELFHPPLPQGEEWRAFWSASLGDDRLSIVLRFPFTLAPEELRERLVRTLSPALELAQRLAKPEDLLARIASNLPAEPEPGLRLRSVRMLAQAPRGHEAAKAALRAALEDADEEVRLEAALACGPAGHPTLKALAANSTISEPTQVRAVNTLGAALSVAGIVALLETPWVAERAGLVAALVESLGRPNRLGEPGTAAAEGLLTVLLPSAQLPLAATTAVALGNLGTVAAVPALREAESRGSRDLSRAARQAVAAIQARLEGAGAGQLTLAGLEAGALSLTEEREAGRVSLTETGDEVGADHRPRPQVAGSREP